MSNLENIYMKIETIDTLFYALEKLIIEEGNQKSYETMCRLETFFYHVQEQFSEVKEEVKEAAKNHVKEKAATIKRLEAENETLKKKLSEFPYTV